jgi:hypothetical protein
MIQKVQTALNFSKKNSKFDKAQLQTQCQTIFKSINHGVEEVHSVFFFFFKIEY